MAINFFEEGGLLNFTKKAATPVVAVTTPVVDPAKVETPKVDEKVETPAIDPLASPEVKDETPEETAPDVITEDMLKVWQPDEAEMADFIDNSPDFTPDLDTHGFLTAKGHTEAHAAMVDSALKNGYAAEQFKEGGTVEGKHKKAKVCGARFKDNVVHGKRVKIYRKPSKKQIEEAKKKGKFGAGSSKKDEIYVEDRENRCEGKGGKPVKKKKHATKKHTTKHEEGGSITSKTKSGEKVKNGDYSWIYLTPEDARKAYTEDFEVFSLNEDGSESVVERESDLKNGGYYGLEVKGKLPKWIKKEESAVKKEKKKTGRKMNNTMALILAEAKKLKAGGSKKQWKDIMKEASVIVKAAKAEEGK